MNGEILKSVKSHVSLSGIYAVDELNKPIIDSKKSFDEIYSGFYDLISKEDKLTLDNYKNTVEYFKKRSFKFDSYPSFEVGDGSAKTRVVNGGDFILAIDSEYICRFNNLADMWAGGEGSCVAINPMERV